MAVKDAALAGEVLWRDERDVPAVGVAGGDGQGAALAAATYPDGEARLHRTRLAAGVLEREPLALEGGPLVVQQAPDALHSLFQDVEARARRREGDAVGVVLDLAPSCPQPHVGSAAREVVDGGDGVGQHGRVAIAGAVDQ